MVSLSLRSSKKMTLAATGKCFHSPASSSAVPPSSFAIKNTLEQTGRGDEFSAAMELPPAHPQLLLTGEAVSYESLTGYDHTLYRKQKSVSSTKHHGGGSWLLGFAGLNGKPMLEFEEEEGSANGMIRELNPPGLIESDEEDSSSESEDDDDASATTDDSSAAASASKPRGVTFSAAVIVRPIPHSSELSSLQRRRMYSTSQEVRRNKIRNKKEYRYDCYDWRNATEEWDMSVDAVTGDLVHPVHDCFDY